MDCCGALNADMVTSTEGRTRSRGLVKEILGRDYWPRLQKWDSILAFLFPNCGRLTDTTPFSTGR
jgi:hypothetical protein